MVNALLLHQLFVGSLLYQGAALQNKNFGGYGCTGKAVGNKEGGFILAEQIKLIEDLLLGNRIQGCGGFVEDENIRIGIKRPCNGELLPLTDRGFNSVLLKHTH